MDPSKKYNIRYFHLQNALYPILNLKKASIILDVGCGTGELTREIEKNSKEMSIVACDINRDSLKEFNNLKNITSVECDAENLKFKKNYFDLVYMIDVLEHLKNPNKAISEISRVIKPKGTFHLVVPCEADLVTIDGWVKLLFNLNLKKKPIGHIQQFTYLKVLNILKENGFKVIRVKFSNYLIYQLISFFYFSYVHFFRKGTYTQLLSEKKKSMFLRILKPLVYLGGYIVNLESFVWANLGLRGQTVHITVVKK